MLYLVHAVLSVCYTQYQLMIMAESDREGWLNFLFYDVGRAMDKERSDGDEDENKQLDTSEYEGSGVRHTWQGLEDRVSISLEDG